MWSLLGVSAVSSLMEAESFVIGGRNHPQYKRSCGWDRCCECLEGGSEKDINDIHNFCDYLGLFLFITRRRLAKFVYLLILKTVLILLGLVKIMILVN